MKNAMMSLRLMRITITYRRFIGATIPLVTMYRPTPMSIYSINSAQFDANQGIAIQIRLCKFAREHREINRQNYNAPIWDERRAVLRIKNNNASERSNVALDVTVHCTNAEDQSGILLRFIVILNPTVTHTTQHYFVFT